MALSGPRVQEAVMNQLTAEERGAGVVYITSSPLPAGTALPIPRLTVEMPWDGYLAFVDPDPLANWGHPCRYLCVHADSGEAMSVRAKFPPFGAGAGGLAPYRWRVLYQAPPVPDSALAIPKA